MVVKGIQELLGWLAAVRSDARPMVCAIMKRSCFQRNTCSQNKKVEESLRSSSVHWNFLEGEMVSGGGGAAGSTGSGCRGDGELIRWWLEEEEEELEVTRAVGRGGEGRA